MIKIEPHITYRATLRLPAGRTDLTERGARMRAEIDKLRRDQRKALAADNPQDPEGGIANAAFRRSGGADEAHFELTVSGTCADAVLAELARLTLALVVRHPISHIAWLQETAVLDRGSFLTALAPRPARPARPRRPATRMSSRPKTRPSEDDAQRARENVIRLDMLRPVSAEEKAILRAELGLPTPQRRAAKAALAVTYAALALNATSAVAEGMAISGLF